LRALDIRYILFWKKLSSAGSESPLYCQ